MYSKIVTFACVLFVAAFASAAVLTPSLKAATQTVRIVAENSSYPSPDYVVNAVQQLKESLEIYPDNEAEQAKFFSALFQSKYPSDVWNVAVGYSTLYVNSTVYLELAVSAAKKVQGKKLTDSKKKEVRYNIFSKN